MEFLRSTAATGRRTPVLGKFGAATCLSCCDLLKPGFWVASAAGPTSLVCGHLNRNELSAPYG